MKTKLNNIALEGTCSGDVVGGLLSWAEGKPSGAFVLKGGFMAEKTIVERAQSLQKQLYEFMNSLVFGMLDERIGTLNNLTDELFLNLGIEKAE